MKNTEKQTYRIINDDLSKEIEHGICVSNLSYHIGKILQLEEKMCYNLAVAGFLHDIGKLEMIKNISRGIGKDPLCVEEMRYLRTHPTLGYAILLQYQYSEEIAKWVLYHHENFDGTGYPSNLAGEEIPLGARILRVCDVFSALVSNRHYRRAYSYDEAIAQMIEEVRYYDIRVFLALMQLVHTTELTKLSDTSDFTP